jgi:hypothetical protein
MKNENAKTIEYVKPAVMDLGAAATIYGAADCVSPGQTATDSCYNDGGSANGPTCSDGALDTT